MDSRNQSRLILLILLMVVIAAVLIADPALAGPGGIIKQAAKTFWGKVIMIALIIFFAPLIIWYWAKRTIMVRRTRKALMDLGRHVDHFEWFQLKERISEVFGWVHSAWDQQKMELASEYMNDWYMKNQQLTLDKWERDGLKNVTSDVKIRSITPLYVAHDPNDQGKDRIVVEIVAEMRDYLVEKGSGKVVEGDKKLGEVTTIWSFVRQRDNWVLSNIEQDDVDMEYLAQPDKVPAAMSERTA